MTNLAIVGLGSWGRRLVQSVNGVSPGVRFSTAVVRRPEPSAEFAQKHGMSIETDLAGLLADSSIDGVVSCGPAPLHAAHSLAALEAGKPVLAIKPMALNAGDAEQLVEASRRKGLLLALGYNRCFFPNVIELRKRLAADALGDLVHAEGNFCVDRYRGVKPGSWKADPESVPAGSLADHMLYLTIETLGPIAEVHALGHRHHSDNELADSAAVLLRTKGRQSALLTAIGVTPDFYRFQVFGTRGWVELRDSRQFSFQPLKGPREDLMLDDIDSERAEMEAFAAAIRGEREFPVAAKDAAHGVAVLNAMGRSALAERPVSLG